MIDSILSIVNKFVPDPNAAMKLAKEMEDNYTKQMEMKSEIIQAEIKNGSGKWRVHLMYLSMGIIACHFILYDLIPYIGTVADLDVYFPDVPDNSELFSFLKVGVGGYIGSRGVEKTIAHWRRR